MNIRDLTLAGLAQALNSYVNMDSDARDRLATLHGRVIAIQLSDLDVTLYTAPQADGDLHILSNIDGTPDCTLRGNALDLWRSGSGTQSARELFAGNVTVTGDTELAQYFGQVLGGLDIDWEEQLSRITGDVVAHQIGRKSRRFAAYLADGTETVRANINEYLTEEARLLPTRIEAENFFGDVDTLRDATERLAARLERLARKLRDRDKS